MSFRRWINVCFVAALLIGVLFVPAARASITVYGLNTFDVAPGAEWSNQSIANGVDGSTERFLGQSDGGYGFGPGAVTLTLNNLPAHTPLSLAFDLYIIRSWDGNGEGDYGWGPDKWELRANGVTKIYTTFANYASPEHTNGPTNKQAYPDMIAPLGSGGTYSPRSGAFASNHLGWGTGDFGDATYRFTVDVADSSSTMVFMFYGQENQERADEGWGLDNVIVTANPVPLPGAIFLLGPGLGVVCAFARRLRRR